MINRLIYTSFVLLWSSVASAQIIHNGSFESAAIDPGAYTGISAGDDDIDGWEVTTGNIDYVGTYWSASDGERSIDLNGNRAGAIRQSFETMRDSVYVVVFDLAGNPDSGPTEKRMHVTVADSTTEFMFSITGHDRESIGWDERTFQFTAADTATALIFTSLVGGAYGPVIDNVRVTRLRETNVQARADLPGTYALFPNYPNPFNPSTHIRYRISQPGSVQINIYDVRGRHVRTLVNGWRQSGEYVITWDGRSDNGWPVVSGIYMYRLTVDDVSLIQTMLLLK